MARNEEKANSMLNRFLRTKYGDDSTDTRPTNTRQVETKRTAERWRIEVVHTISRRIKEIQNPLHDDDTIKQLNDEINELLREKWRWERRIVELGGTDHTARTKAKFAEDGESFDFDSRSYKYFGRAKDLPGVREFLSQGRKAQEEADSFRLQTEASVRFLYKGVDADYYGFGTEETATASGTALVDLEAQREDAARRRVMAEYISGFDPYAGFDLESGAEITTPFEELSDRAVLVARNAGVQDLAVADEDDEEGYIPTQEEMQAALLAKRKAEVRARLTGNA